MINITWKGFRLAVVAVVLLVVGALIVAHFRLNPEVRATVAARLAEAFKTLDVTFETAELVEGQGIRIGDLRIRDPQATSAWSEIVQCDRVILHCPTDWQTLLCEEPTICKIVFHRPTIRLVRHGESWNLMTLLAGGAATHAFDACKLPEIQIDGGTLIVADPARGPSCRLTFREINGSISAPGCKDQGDLSCAAGSGCSTDRSGVTASSILADISSPLSPPQKQNNEIDHLEVEQPALTNHHRTVRLSCLGDFFGQISLAASLRTDDWSGRLEGTIQRIELLPEMRDAMPLPVSTELAPLQQLRGEIALGLVVEHHPGEPDPIRYDIAGRFSQGRLDDNILPHPLTELSTLFRVSNRGFSITDLSARSGPAAIQGSFEMDGFKPGSPMRLTGSFEQLAFDGRLFEKLPEKMKEQWRRLDPAGRIDGGGRAEFDGQQWRTRFSARLADLSLSYHKLPYRVRQGQGSLTLDDGRLQFQIAATGSGGCPISLRGDVQLPTTGMFDNPSTGASALANDPYAAPIGPGYATQPRNAWTGWVEASGEQVAIDQQMLESLPEKARAVMTALAPRGSLDFRMRSWRDDPAQLKPHVRLTVLPNYCTIRYDKFPYPISTISGRLEMLDNDWTFDHLQGRNDTGRITATGTLKTIAGNKELILKLGAINLPLDEELRDALPKGMQRLWNDMRPDGSVTVSMDIVHRFGIDSKPNIMARVEPDPACCSINPTVFPYRLDNLSGVAIYNNGQVTVEPFRGTHGDVRLSATVTARTYQDGQWHFQLRRLAADRVRFDRELIVALPASIQKTVTTLKPSGPLNIRGDFELAGGPDEESPVRSAWNLMLDLQQNGIECGMSVDNLFGTVQIVGGFDGLKMRSRAELNLDSATYNGMQFTRITGPLYFDESQVLTGSWVPPVSSEGTENVTPRRMSANVVGGVLESDARIVLSDTPTYRIRLSLIDGSLKRCVQELSNGQHDISGSIYMNVDLTGTGTATGSRSGTGHIHFRKSNIYKLPAMVSMLKILSIREPDRTGFTQGDISFRIQGRHYTFNRIDLQGDAISLVGQGEMDSDRNLDLRFYTMVGRGQVNIPLIGDLYRGASQQFLGIEVGGTLSDPKIDSQPFPVARTILDRLRNEQQMQRNPSLGPSPQTHHIRQPGRRQF